MAQLNQLLTSGSNVATPPVGYLAMFFGPSNSIGFKDANGVIIEPTASLTAITASLAMQAEALTAGDKTVQGSLTVTGTLTAKEYIVSSSVTNIIELNASGSSKFGDSLDDTHQMTGSFLVTGSATITGPANITSVTSSFQGNVVGNVTGSISGSTAQFNSLTGSLLGNITGSISGSTAQFVSITGSLLGNVVGNITGSISGSTATFNQITASNLSVTSTGSIGRLQVTTDAVIRNGTANIVVGNRGNSNSLVFGTAALPSEAAGFNFNTAIGNSTLANLGPGAANTALGSGAGQNILTGSDNTFLGRYSAGGLLSGSNNTFVGSVISIITGSNNTIIGKGVTVADNTNNNIVLGDGEGNIRARYSGSWVLATGVTSPSFTGSLNGSVVGNVTGSLSGSVVGNVTGSISGSTARFISTTSSLLGDVVGNITGSISGSTARFSQVTSSTLLLTQNATITSNLPNTTALTLQGSGSFSGGNQFDFIRAQNTNAGVPTPYKFFRVNNSGSFDIVNSAYDTPILTLGDSGSLLVTDVTASSFSGSAARITRLTASNSSLTNTTLFNNTIFTSNTAGEAALYIKGSGSTDVGSKNFDVFLLENTNAGVPTPLKYLRLNPSGALEILSNAKSQIFTLNNDGGLNIASNFTASNIWANSNGTGKNFAIGDDMWMGDINISNYTQLSGQQDPTQAYLKFASGSGTPIIWTTGSNTLNLNGSFTVNPSGGIELRVTNTGVTIGNSLADTHRITGSFLVTGSTHVYGDIKVGNVTDVSSGENTLSVYPPAQGGTGEGGQILLAAAGGTFTSASMIDTYQNRFRILKGTNTGGSTTEYLSLDLNTGGIQATSITSSFSGTLNGATIDSGSWIAYTPTWTATSNPAIGNGTIEGYYKVIGKTCFVRGNVQMGSTTTFGSGEWHVGLPFSAKHADAIQMTVSILDAGSAWYNAQLNGARAGFSDKSAIQYVNHTNGTADSVSPTTPITWASGDRFMFNGSYEIA